MKPLIRAASLVTGSAALLSLLIGINSITESYWPDWLIEIGIGCALAYRSHRLWKKAK